MSLAKFRNKIDAIDAKLVSLLNERAKMSKAIGAEKNKSKKRVYAPDREKQVLTKLKSLNKGLMSDDALQAIYREVMSCSLSLEKPLNIAFLGTEGSFTYMAARKKFGSQVDYVSCSSILDVFQKVEHEECEYGVVPIENSTEGAVTHTFDLLIDFELKVYSQIMLKISHNLLSHAPLDKIKKIYSNPQVFGQCRNWLSRHLPQSKAGQISIASTTEAACRASKEKNAAAIASMEASRVYDLPVVRKNLQDIAHNTTRFLIIATNDVPRTGDDRTSIVFSIKDKVGALYNMLAPFYKNKINLTKIESRPSKKKAWDYYFFIDFEGHREDKKVEKALNQLEDMCKFMKILGSYPA